MTANWKWSKLRNKHDVSFLYCFVITLVSSSLLLIGMICGTFNVQENGIEAWKGRRWMNAKKENPEGDRGGLSSIYLIMTVPIMWK